MINKKAWVYAIIGLAIQPLIYSTSDNDNLNEINTDKDEIKELNMMTEHDGVDLNKLFYIDVNKDRMIPHLNDLKKFYLENKQQIQSMLQILSDKQNTQYKLLVCYLQFRKMVDNLDALPLINNKNKCLVFVSKFIKIDEFIIDENRRTIIEYIRNQLNTDKYDVNQITRTFKELKIKTEIRTRSDEEQHEHEKKYDEALKRLNELEIFFEQNKEDIINQIKKYYFNDKKDLYKILKKFCRDIYLYHKIYNKISHVNEPIKIIKSDAYGDSFEKRIEKIIKVIDIEDGQCIESNYKDRIIYFLKKPYLQFRQMMENLRSRFIKNKTEDQINNAPQTQTNSILQNNVDQTEIKELGILIKSDYIASYEKQRIIEDLNALKKYYLDHDIQKKLQPMLQILSDKQNTQYKPLVCYLQFRKMIDNFDTIASISGVINIDKFMIDENRHTIMQYMRNQLTMDKRKDSYKKIVQQYGIIECKRSPKEQREHEKRYDKILAEIDKFESLFEQNKEYIINQFKIYRDDSKKDLYSTLKYFCKKIDVYSDDFTIYTDKQIKLTKSNIGGDSFEKKIEESIKIINAWPEMLNS